LKKNILFITLLFCAIHTSLSAQRITKHTVYFDVDSYKLSASEETSLKEFIQSEVTNSYVGTIRIEGHTDSDASNAYNQKLSQNRVKSVQHFFEGTSLQPKVETAWMGEDQPLNKNASESEKQQNRRVEITVDHWIPDLVESEGTIKDLYALLEQKKQVFCINPKGDTVIRLKQGTIVSFPEYPFGKLAVPCVELRFKEVYKKSDILLENLSTVSNGRLLESAGMVYIEAAVNNQLISLAPGKEVLVMIPTDTLRDDMQGFNGERDSHTDVMNWFTNNGSNFSKINMIPGQDCQEKFENDLLGNCERCNLLFCRFKRIDEGFKGTVNKGQHQDNKSFRECQRELRKRARGRLYKTSPTIVDSYKNCTELDSLFKQFGVTNREDLFLAMNKEIMDEYGVKTIEALRDTLNKIKLKKIEENLLKGNVDKEELQYYMYNTTRLGWINCDAFSKLDGIKITMETDFKSHPQHDCKAVFVGVRGVLPATAIDDYFQFLSVPKNNDFWLIAMRFENKQAYLSMELLKTTEEVKIKNMKKVTLEELKEALRKLDQ
jgi:hypothetical protein